MSHIPNRVCRVEGRRPRRTERQNPYYRPHSRPLQTESTCARQRNLDDSRQQQTNDEWNRRALNEDALYPSSSQERSRSRNHRHSDRYFDARRTHSKSPSRSTVRNCYLPNTHKDFQVWQSDIFPDFSRQRSGEMACSKGQRFQSSRSKAHEQRIDQQNLEFDQQAGSQMGPSKSRNWSDMIELEELASEQQNSDFEAEYNGLCPEQLKEEFDDIPVQRCTLSHVRQDSMMSNPSSLGSDSTTESKRIRMSATPRYTQSELNTKEVQAIIARRKKQIQYGKVLGCYDKYIQVVPRRRRTKYHPRTPDIYRSYSRRGFDTLVRTWKKQIHAWEPVEILGRSMTLGSTCESSMTTDATDAVKSCKKEMKEDLDDYEYDVEFPPLPTASATVKTEGSSELPSVGSSITIKTESSDDDTSVCGVVVKTEKPDDFF